jgi:Protein of unknown function (DUF2809)
VPLATPFVNGQKRLLFVAATLATIGIGLASRKWPGLFPAFLGQYPGDALWSLMLFFAFSAIAPKAKVSRVLWAALLVSFAVEFGQLVQTPWVQSVRATTWGHLVLGSGFNAWDLLAYAVGIAFGAGLRICGLICR